MVKFVILSNKHDFMSCSHVLLDVRNTVVFVVYPISLFQVHFCWQSVQTIKSALILFVHQVKLYKNLSLVYPKNKDFTSVILQLILSQHSTRFLVFFKKHWPKSDLSSDGINKHVLVYNRRSEGKSVGVLPLILVFTL